MNAADARKIEEHSRCCRHCPSRAGQLILDQPLLGVTTRKAPGSGAETQSEFQEE